MHKRFFVTATDTNAGKTYVSSGLLRIAAARGLSSTGYKPVASGCTLVHACLHNEDIAQLVSASSSPLTHHNMNTHMFMPAIAPHIAAQQCGIKLTMSELLQRTHAALARKEGIQIIEGFGGWHAPLNMHETMADYAAALNCDVIMVTGIRLGCLNHSILTERAILASGAKCAGWIANIIDPEMPHQQENIQTLQAWLQSPLLGIVPYGVPAETALQHHTIF